MKRRHKTIIFHIVGLLIAFAVLFFSNVTISLQDERIPTYSEMLEEYFDGVVNERARSDTSYMHPEIVLFESDDVARKYARILYLEKYGGTDWDFKVWVKHYKNHGVWLAVFRAYEPNLDGPSVIIFRDTDGKVLWFGR